MFKQPTNRGYPNGDARAGAARAAKPRTETNGRRFGGSAASVILLAFAAAALLAAALTSNAGFQTGTSLLPKKAAAAPAGAPPAQSSGGAIAFHSKRDGNWEIYAMNADGGGLARLTNNSAWDASPSWSPDGRRIAFWSNRDGNTEIYAMNADGSGAARLTNNSDDDYYPSWSPDGRRIAFASDRDGNYEIYSMNADGSGLVRLTNNSDDDYSPSWSPDGRRIAFNSDRDGNFEIYAMNADGSGAARLTNNSADDYSPSWSPDGRRIAFNSDRDGNFEIYAMNADGSGAARLTNNSADDWSPSWSPDGRRIAFHSDRDGNWEIYAMNADGSGAARLTNNSAVDAWPSWGPASVPPTITPTPEPAYDHGDSRSSATRISDGSSANGVIRTSSDVDYFSFQAERGRRYTIETSIPSGSDVDTVISLYGASGSRLDRDDDGGSGYASKIVWTAPSSDVYYVKVEAWGSQTGGYRLSLSSDAPTQRAAATAEARAHRAQATAEARSQRATATAVARSQRAVATATARAQATAWAWAWQATATAEARPTSTPTPTPTPTPTITPTPTPRPVSCPPGKPCVALHSDRTTVDIGEPINLTLAAVNDFTLPDLTIQMVIEVPIGWSVRSAEMTEACTALCNIIFEKVPAGVNRSSRIEIFPNETGDFSVHTTLKWFNGEATETSVERREENIGVKVNPKLSPTPTATPAPRSARLVAPPPSRQRSPPASSSGCGLPQGGAPTDIGWLLTGLALPGLAFSGRLRKRAPGRTDKPRAIPTSDSPLTPPNRPSTPAGCRPGRGRRG